MIARRRFLGAAAVVPSLVTNRTGVLAAAASLGSIKARQVGKVEIVFKSPNGSQPNGLQATAEGLWIIDQAAGNKVYLVAYDDGRVLRSFETETDRSSGITFENGTLWIGSTYSREIVHCDAATGKTISRNFTPGAGVIYKMVGDPPARSVKSAREAPAASAAKGAGLGAKCRSEQGRWLPGGTITGEPGAGHRGARAGMARRQTVDGCAACPDGLSCRSQGMDRGEEFPDRRKSSAWHRLGRQVSVGGRFQSECLLQARPRYRRDGREDTACRFRSLAARHEHPGWLDVVLRRRGRGLPAEAITRNATITRPGSISRR